jgi:hypothetical protein
MQILIKRSGATILTVKNPLSSSDYQRTLMGDNTVTLVWEQPTYTSLLVGDYIIHDGVKFTINQLPTVKKLSTKLYQYNAVFQSPIYDLLKAGYMLFDNTATIPSGEFSLTGTPETFIVLLADNLNRIFGDSNFFSVGQVIEAEAKTLTFSNENCHEVLTRLATEFDTEYSLDDGNIINLIEITNTANITLEYGSTIYDIERKSIDSSSVITRLYPRGSEKNIAATYRNGSSRLLLPNPLQYLEANVALYGVIEGQKTFDAIYPRLGATSAGTVTTVYFDNKLKFTDVNLDFDLNSYLLPGTSAKLRFTTGQCAGYDLEIKSFTNSTKTFVVIQNEDDKGFKIPNGDLYPAVGDKYVLLDVNMPPAYVTAAELELQAKAQEYINENSHPKVSYTVTFSSVWAKVNAPDLRPGDLVEVYDANLGINTDLRVIKIVKGISDSYNVKVDLSDTVSKSTLTRIAAEIAANTAGITEAKKGVSQNFSRNWRNVEELSTMIDTLRADMLFVGNVQGQFALSGVLFTPNYQNDKNKFYATAGSLVHKTIPSDATPGTWTLPVYAPTITGDTTPYYLYAKCSRTAITGVFYLSANSIVYDSDAAYYYFLVGVLSSVTDGVRTLQTTYGFTQITGKQVVTGKIQSADGNTYFNLDNGEIGGNLKFKSGSTYKEVGTGITEAVSAVKIGGRNLISQTIYPTYIPTGSWYVQNNGIGITTKSSELTNATDSEPFRFVISYRNPIKKAGYYAVSFWYKHSGGLVLNWNININDVNVGSIQEQSVENIWKKFEGTVYIDNYIGIYGFIDFRAVGGNWATVLISDLMIEDGNKVSTYKPAPEDVSAYSDAVAELKRIEAEANSDGKINAAEARAIADAKARVDGMVVGGRNLILNSKFNLDTNTYGGNERKVSLLAGHEYILSMNGNALNAMNGKLLICYIYNPLWTWAQAITITSTVDITKSVAFTIPISMDYFIDFYYSDNSSPRTGSIRVNWLKLEIGNKATDWTPAPEDIQSQIDASKALLADITDDNKLTPEDKKRLKPIYDSIVAEYMLLSNQCDSVGAGTWDMFYDTGEDIKNYLAPFLADLETTSTVDGSYIRNKFSSYYTQKVDIVNKINNAINEKAETAKNAADEASIVANAIANNLTTIDGGLILTTLIKMLNGSVESAGMAAKTPQNDIAFWGGGSLEQAIQRLTNFGVTHSGEAWFKGIIEALGGKIGGLNISENSLSSATMEFTEEPIETLDSLKVSETSTFTMPWDNFNNTVIKVWGNTSATIISPTFTVNKGSFVAFRVATNYTNLAVVCRIKDSSNNIVSSYSYTSDGTYKAVKLELYSAGNYTIECTVTGSNTVNIAIIGETDWKTVNLYTYNQRTKIGNNGLYSFWDIAKYFYFSSLTGLSIRGLLDIPTGLGGASINSVGAVSIPWGKITDIGKVVKSGSNYTITHNIGDTNYSIIMSPNSGNIPYFSSKAPNTIVVTCSGGVDFILIRTQ